MMTKKKLNIIILGVFSLSGLAALMYEVIWTRALTLVLGSTVYAMSIILSTFMAGLAIGSLWGGRISDRTDQHLRLLGTCELIIGVFGLIAIPIIYMMPEFYLAIYRSLHLTPKLFMLTQMLLCSAAIIVPTVMMGATFPLVSRIITDNFAELGTKVGRAYFWNTIGAVAGSLLAGFVMIPMLGIRWASVSTAMINVVIGLLLSALSKGSFVKPVGLAVVPLVFGCYLTANASQGSFMVNYYSMHNRLNNLPYETLAGIEKRVNHLVFSGEYSEGDVKAFKQDDGSLMLQVGGKVEGTSIRDMDNTILLAYLPLASHPDPRDVLVIGLGAGITLGAAKDQNQKVDLVEINPGVVEAVSRVGIPGLLNGIRIIKDDARNYLFYTEKKYDVISSEPSYPSESSVASLFTSEFYRIASKKLKQNGVYCQWLPYYMLSNNEITMMLKTFVSVFPHSYLWKVTKSMDLILVGSLDPINASVEEITRRVTSMNLGSPELGYRLSRNPQQLQEIAQRKDVPVNTDDRPLLEFAAADNFILGDLSLKDRK